jgi:hypothetical protein
MASVLCFPTSETFLSHFSRPATSIWYILVTPPIQRRTASQYNRVLSACVGVRTDRSRSIVGVGSGEIFALRCSLRVCSAVQTVWGNTCTNMRIHIAISPSLQTFTESIRPRNTAACAINISAGLHLEW